jgi:hypothetical protein
MIRKLGTAVSLAVLLWPLAAPPPAAAQGFSVLNPLAPSYTLLGFVYEPPKGEGWREVGKGADMVHLIYAEQLAEGQINTRGDFTAQSFPVSLPEKVQLPDGFTLTRLSQAQRLKEKKDENVELVALSEPAQLGDSLVYEYTLVLKIANEDVLEHYFVALAPDKSEYVAAKIVSKDKDLRDQPYFKAVQDSMKLLKFGSAPSTDSARAAPTDESKDPQKPAGAASVAQ